MPVKYIKKYKESTGTEEGGGLKDTRVPDTRAPGKKHFRVLP